MAQEETAFNLQQDGLLPPTMAQEEPQVTSHKDPLDAKNSERGRDMEEHKTESGWEKVTNQPSSSALIH